MELNLLSLYPCCLDFIIRNYKLFVVISHNKLTCTLLRIDTSPAHNMPLLQFFQLCLNSSQGLCSCSDYW
ncbi:hypothetical protein RchiOBHm_Chr4g0407351 [Rosa chinensis]|uniref:Uncharacterized protein n=1 Tax=Rosa chinensis TaxID=74649 RepID=A0A2P6QUK4_ROSCH|nr:hypothetical protein RchiOBHm_Chr4g0407351 [Rosa chinensis]